MKNLFNFAKKDFFIFASTYIAIILLLLLCLFPVCRAFEVSEQKQALAEIRDYASSMLANWIFRNPRFSIPPEIFTATGILLRSIMIVHEAPPLPCFMT